MKIYSRIKSFNDRYNGMCADIEEHERKIAEIKGELHKIFWVDEVIYPIARQLAKHFPDRNYEVLGPFGIGARVSIHFQKKGTEKLKFGKRFINGNCISITFEPDLEGNRLFVVDYSKDTGKYANGSIGELNGFNFETIEVPRNASAKWMLQWVK